MPHASDLVTATAQNIKNGEIENKILVQPSD